MLTFLLLTCLGPAWEPQTQQVSYAFVDQDLQTVLAFLVRKAQLAIVYPDDFANLLITSDCEQCEPREALSRIADNTPYRWTQVGDQFILAHRPGARGSLRGQIKTINANLCESPFHVEIARRQANGPARERFWLAAQGDGTFVFEQIPIGLYLLRAKSCDEHPSDWVAMEIKPNTWSSITIDWHRTPTLEVPLAKVVVTTNRHALLNSEVGVPLILSREEIAQTPNLGGDVLKLSENLPGVTGTDTYSDVRVRGGDGRDMAILVDGTELNRPLHFSAKNLGLFSVIQSDSLSHIELLTGVFPAEYGNKHGGALRFETASPQGPRSSTFETNFLSMKMRTEGTFADAQGNYALSARHGFLDLIFGLSDSGTGTRNDATFDDLMGRVQYVFPGHVLTASYLWTQSQLRIDEPKEPGNRTELEQIKMDGNGYQTWFRLQSVWTSNLTSESRLSLGSGEFDVSTTDNYNAIRYNMVDNRTFDHHAIEQDWTYDFNGRHFLKWGFSLSREKALYDYHHRREGDTFLGDANGTRDHQMDLSTTQVGAYLASRTRFNPRLTAELGLRFDRQTHTHDPQWSPRTHLVYSPSAAQVVKLGWGLFHQAQDLSSLQIGDGQTSFSAAERAQKVDLSYQRYWTRGLAVVASVYSSHIDHQYTRYFNFLDNFSLEGEMMPDRVGLDLEETHSRGLELLLKNTSESWSWMASYALSKVESQWRNQTLALPWDQRHAVKISLNYHPSSRWHFNSSWFWHTGWRTTEVGLQEVVQSDGSVLAVPVVGPYFGQTLPDYHRMDVRLHRQFSFRKQRSLSIYLEVVNAYNKANTSSIDNPNLISNGQGRLRLTFDRGTWIERTPSLGFKLHF